MTKAVEKGWVRILGRIGGRTGTSSWSSPRAAFFSSTEWGMPRTRSERVPKSFDRKRSAWSRENKRNLPSKSRRIAKLSFKRGSSTRSRIKSEPGLHSMLRVHAQMCESVSMRVRACTKGKSRDRLGTQRRSTKSILSSGRACSSDVDAEVLAFKTRRTAPESSFMS